MACGWLRGHQCEYFQEKDEQNGHETKTYRRARHPVVGNPGVWGEQTKATFKFHPASLLEEILKQEKTADRALTGITP
jgi:hypothetical protein